MYPELAAYIRECTAEIARIAGNRRPALDGLSGFVRDRVSRGRPARLTFVCTHNSRRSQMCQMWACAAAVHFGVAGVETFSGGTEATAFDLRAVEALRRAGMRIERTRVGHDPGYRVRYGPAGPVVRAFSKVYDREPNPTEDFCAVMTCSQAERDCPVVRGAAVRISLPFDDPKEADGTDREAAAYDERCRQIAREMLYVFSTVRGL